MQLPNGSLSDPGLFVHFFDVWQDRLLLTRLSEEDFHTLSFLDQRALVGRPQEYVSWDELSRMPVSARETGFIFHIGHVGSTLLSRLLGEIPAVLPVREPLILRTFAELERARGRPEAPWPPEEQDIRLNTALGWLSRSFRPGQQAIVKATSFASDLAGQVGQGRKVIFLFVGATTYVQTILAGEASTQELKALRSARLARLHKRLGEQPWRLWCLTIGEVAAMAWACEMGALVDAAARLDPADVLWMDFDAFLAAPVQHLTLAARHLGHSMEEDFACQLMAGSIMRTYSKAPEHDYSPNLRQAVLAQAAQEHRRELDLARKWLESAAEHPLIRQAIERAGF